MFHLLLFTPKRRPRYRCNRLCRNTPVAFRTYFLPLPLLRRLLYSFYFSSSTNFVVESRQSHPTRRSKSTVSSPRLISSPRSWPHSPLSTLSRLVRALFSPSRLFGPLPIALGNPPFATLSSAARGDRSCSIPRFSLDAFSSLPPTTISVACSFRWFISPLRILRQ